MKFEKMKWKQVEKNTIRILNTKQGNLLRKR